MRNATSATSISPPSKRTVRRRSEVAALEEERDRWLAQVSPECLFYPLFDQLPGVCFFVKDAQGRTMAASRAILERYRMRDEREMLGRTDFEINPRAMAAGYVRDDQRLLSRRARKIERLELWFDRQGRPDWFVVTKLPVLDRQQRPCGVMGVLRRAEEHEMQLPVFQTVARAVAIVQREYAAPLKMAELAARCGQSLRHLQRRFQSAFGVSPQEFLLQTRVLAAADELERTSLSAAEIALRCGFVDASNFTLHFRRRMGQVPMAYRQARASR